MKLLRYFASAFIDVFGITHPSTEARDHAARYIAFLFVAMIAVLLLVLLLAAHLLSS